MSAYPAPWALCGGWAVDAWLDRHTRDHGDVDIAVFMQDRQALFDHLSDWQLVAHYPGADDLSARWDGRALELPAHLHGRPDNGEPVPESGILMPEQGFILDVQFCERSGDDWLLSREPWISLPLRDAIRQSPWGVPAAVAEVLLFYKSGGPGIHWLRRRDKQDFLSLLPVLSAEQRDWLRDALLLVGHPWVGQLTAV